MGKDPIFNYTDDELSYSMENYIYKNTTRINFSAIDDSIFNFTYLEKKNEQIYISDQKYITINYTDESRSNLEPYQKRHRFEFNVPMILQLTNSLLGIILFFIWNSIRFKHKKLIQKGVMKKYGKKIMYAGYTKFFLFIPIFHVKWKEEHAAIEIRNSSDYILDVDIEGCSHTLNILIEFFIIFIGSLIVFIVLIVKRNKENFTTKALYFPFSLTYFGERLYYYLLIFLIVSFGIYLLFVSHIDIWANHHENINYHWQQRLGGIVLFTEGLFIYSLVFVEY